MAVHVLLRLAALTGEPRYRAVAERALAGVAPFLARYPSAFAWWLCALEVAHRGITEVAIVGDPADDAVRQLVLVAGRGLHGVPGARGLALAGGLGRAADARPVRPPRPRDRVRLPRLRLPPARPRAGGARGAAGGRVSGIAVREASEDELDAAGALVARAYLALGTPDDKDSEYGEYLDHIRDARGPEPGLPGPGGGGRRRHAPRLRELRARRVEPVRGRRGRGRGRVPHAGRGPGGAGARRGAGAGRGVHRTGPGGRPKARRARDRPGHAGRPSRVRAPGVRAGARTDFEPVPGIGLWVYVLEL